MRVVELFDERKAANMAEDIRTNLRIPAEVYERVKESAERDRRSINAQMVVLLQEALDARQPKTTPPSDGVFF